MTGKASYVPYGTSVYNCDENNNAIDIAKRVGRVVTCVSQIQESKSKYRGLMEFAADGTPPAGGLWRGVRRWRQVCGIMP
jgi:hypothetical protein